MRGENMAAPIHELHLAFFSFPSVFSPVSTSNDFIVGGLLW